MSAALASFLLRNPGVLINLLQIAIMYPDEDKFECAISEHIRHVNERDGITDAISGIWEDQQSHTGWPPQASSASLAMPPSGIANNPELFEII